MHNYHNVSTSRVAEMCLNVFDCVFSPSSAVYLSTPVTTGDRFYRWVKDGGDPCAPSRPVINENTEFAYSTALHLREATHKNVINPAAFYQESWTQAMYLSFWVDVIKRFAAEVWLNEGWEFSNGCTYEYYAAVEAGIPCFTINGQKIDVPRAIELISVAIEKMSLVNMDTASIESTLKNLRKMM